MTTTPVRRRRRRDPLRRAGPRHKRADAAARTCRAGPVRRLLRREGSRLSAAEALDVPIKPCGLDIAPPKALAGGGADVIVAWRPAALAARERGRRR